jgi:hypothetical protein
VGFRRVWIPHVEAWHDGPISLLAAARQVLLIPARYTEVTAVPTSLSDPELIPLLERAAALSSEPAVEVRPEFATQLQEWENKARDIAGLSQDQDTSWDDAQS